MWNDISGREKSGGSYKRKSGDKKESSNTYNFGSPSTSPSPDHAPFTPINTTNSLESNASYCIRFDEELMEIWLMGRIIELKHIFLIE